MADSPISGLPQTTVAVAGDQIPITHTPTGGNPTTMRINVSDLATGNYVDLSTNQTISGVKTFNQAPASPNGFASGASSYGVSASVAGALQVTGAIQPSANIGPTVTAGNGAPGSVQPNGSIYLRADGGAGTRLYVSNGATWAAVAGV